jgi:AmiR/NasT family two-component response regulator
MLSLRVAIADQEPKTLESLEKVLCELGHKVVAAVHDGHALIKECVLARPDVVITGPLTTELNGRDTAAAVFQNRAIPILLCARNCDPDLVIDAENKHVFMYLVEPIFPEYLQVALNECHRSFAVEPMGDFDNSAPSNLVLSSSTAPPHRAQLRPPYRQLPR